MFRYYWWILAVVCGLIGLGFILNSQYYFGLGFVITGAACVGFAIMFKNQNK